MTASVQIARNAVTAKLIDPDPQAKQLVSKALSYIVEGAGFTGAFANGWNGRSTFFSQTANTFPAGFTHAVQHELINAGYQVRLVRRPLPAPLGPENPIVDEFGNDDPRYDYQMETVNRLLRHGAGIAQIATGGGKSKIAKLAVARIRRPTLFLTTRSVLMYQMADSFREAGFKVGLIGDGAWSPIKGVNCAMVQTIVQALEETTIEAERREIVRQFAAKDLEPKRKEIAELAKKRFEDRTAARRRMLKLLEIFELVIGEEAHEAGGNSYYEILRHCRNANYRLALTATPFMRESAEDNMRLMAAFGPVLIKVPENLLIERGILAKPYFMFANYEPHPKLRKTSPWQRAVQLGIVESPDRNATILNYAKRGKALGLPVMTLVTRVPHGEHLQTLMEDAGLSVRFIRGETDTTARKRALEELGTGQIDVLIGTNILDVGVDVPAVGMVILAGGGKAEIALRQRIGRALRAKKKGPNIAFVVDFNDSLNSYLRAHAASRRAIIESTPGFAENIVPSGGDLPWHLLAA